MRQSPQILIKSICIIQKKFSMIYVFRLLNLDNQPDPQINPNYTQIQNILSLLTPFMASGYFFTGQKSGRSGKYHYYCIIRFKGW